MNRVTRKKENRSSGWLLYGISNVVNKTEKRKRSRFTDESQPVVNTVRDPHKHVKQVNMR